VTFILSKLLWFVVQPLQVVVVVIVAGVLAGFTRWPRAGRWLTAVGAISLAVIVWSPLGRFVLLPLETRFPIVTQLPEHVDGIVVLGGTVMPERTAEVGQPSLTDGAERLIEAVMLARRFPAARLVFSGGSGLLAPRVSLTEADVARMVFTQLGLSSDRVLYESASRNTWENALYTKALVNPQSGETWLLVTSAYHMPRSVGIFRQVDWPVLPYPVDFRAGREGANIQQEPTMNIENVQISVHEWIGLFTYFVIGRIDELFPSP
jgi:uncharacterized SAM-binding protein YcdF (DUF218 family)